VLEPSEINDGKEKIIKATVASFGNSVHSFIERQTPSDILPFYAPLHYTPQNIDIGLEAIDHLAIAVEIVREQLIAGKLYQNITEANTEAIKCYATTIFFAVVRHISLPVWR